MHKICPEQTCLRAALSVICPDADLPVCCSFRHGLRRATFLREEGFCLAQTKLVSPSGRDVAQRQICALLPLIFSPPSAMMLFVSFRAGSNLLNGDKEAGALYSRRNL